jgi:TfoX/Sxy family transcriptional regulator of competence genes
MKMPKAGPVAVKKFEELIPPGPTVGVRKVFGQPAAFVNGNMFFGVFGDWVFLRLSEEDRHEIEKIPGVQPFEPMKGRPMRGYVILPEHLLQDRTKTTRWIAQSLSFASKLPAKIKKKR